MIKIEVFVRGMLRYDFELKDSSLSFKDGAAFKDDADNFYLHRGDRITVNKFFLGIRYSSKNYIVNEKSNTIKLK